MGTKEGLTKLAQELEEFNNLILTYEYKNLTPLEFINSLNVFDLEKRKEILTAFCEIYKKDAHQYIYNQLMEYDHNYDWTYFLLQNLIDQIYIDNSDRKFLANKLFTIIERFRTHSDLVCIALDIVGRTIDMKDIPKLFTFLGNDTLKQTIMILSRFTLDKINENKNIYHAKMSHIFYNIRSYVDENASETDRDLIVCYAFLNLVLSKYYYIDNIIRDLRCNNLKFAINFTVHKIKERNLDINISELESVIKNDI